MEHSKKPSLIESLYRQFCFSHFQKDYLPDSTRLILQTDTIPIIKSDSPTLPNRTYVAIPNVKVKGNKPIDTGYEVSFIKKKE